MKYNKGERLVAALLSKFPALKGIVKKLYQRLNYIRYKKKYTFDTQYQLTKFKFENEESFFGYYDKSPINKSNKFVVFHSSPLNTKKLPSFERAINIVLYDIEADSYQLIDETQTYNWQQGSKLMWLNEFEFIYNCSKNDSYISKIYNIKTRDYREISLPIYDCYHSEFAISLNFDRLQSLRPDYGYRMNSSNPSIDWKNNDEDGVYFINLKDNEHKLLISLNDVINSYSNHDFGDARHKLNHLMISPDGSHIMFLHRWFFGERKYDSLLVAEIDGSNIKCLSNDGMVSHCFWCDNNNIIGYLRDEVGGDKYYKINSLTAKKTIVGADQINAYGDGHPSINNNAMIFDTYPNKARMKELFKFNLQSEQLEKLGEFFEPFDFYGETRCDLHPRFSPDSDKVFFDSVHEGKRHLYMLNLAT